MRVIARELLVTGRYVFIRGIECFELRNGYRVAFFEVDVCFLAATRTAALPRAYVSPRLRKNGNDADFLRYHFVKRANRLNDASLRSDRRNIECVYAALCVSRRFFRDPGIPEDIRNTLCARGCGYGCCIRLFFFCFSLKECHIIFLLS